MIISIFLPLVYIVDVAHSTAPDDYFMWQELSFAWPDTKTRDSFIQSGEYVPKNSFPFGLDRWRNKLFITVPRLRPGVPASLTYVPLNSPTTSPDLIPYPSWEENLLPASNNTLPSDNKVVSAFRVKVDECDRLWVIDMAIDNIANSFDKTYGPPSIVIYDLATDELIRRYPFKKEVLKENSLFPNIIVDVPGRCDKAFAYIPDMLGYGLVVYSFADNDSWRIKHNFFLPDPLKGDFFNVGGFNFQWTDGVCGLALGDRDARGYRTMYFHSVCSNKEFSVSTQVLRNKTLAEDRNSYTLFRVEGDKGDNTQSIISDFDPATGVLFLTLLGGDGVACWNTRKPLNPGDVAMVVKDHEKLIFTNDIKIDDERNLWILSNNFPKFIYANLNFKEVNFRIFKIPVDDLIRGTVCEEDILSYYYVTYF